MKKISKYRLLKWLFLGGSIFIFSRIFPAPPGSPSLSLASPRTIGMAQYPLARDDTAPEQNITNLFNLYSNGIEKIFGKNDLVAIKVSASFPEQGYTNSRCLRVLIEKILNRPGGFNGEIVIFDNIHRPNPDNDLSSGWAADVLKNNTRNNGENLNSLIKSFESTGKVFKVHLEDVAINPQKWVVLNPNSPQYPIPPEGKNGWIRHRVSIPNSGRDVTLSVPVFRLPNGKIINLSSDGGIYENGKKTSQPLKLIIATPLNYHSKYAGVEGAVRAHFGLIELPGGISQKEGHFEDGSLNLHTLGYTDNRPEWVGTAIGIYIKQYLYPALYICCAEWSGFAGTFGAGTAIQTKVVAICDDPVTIDYYLGKYVLFSCDKSRLWNNPENNFAFGRTLKACFQQGIGTIDENEMTVLLYDNDNPPTRVHDWIFIQ